MHREAGPAATREPRPVLPGFAAIAATYVAFLLWAQFGFVELIHERLGAGAGPVKAAMAAMGIAGLATSLGTGALLKRVAALSVVRAGLAAVALAAVAALACRGPLAFGAVAAVTGAAIATLTVALAAGLRDLVPGRRAGLVVGGATGTAYLACNVPALFEAGPREQALIVATLCAAALLVLARLPARSAERTAAAGADRGARSVIDAGLAAGIAAFLALVWIDSAAFAAIQARSDLSAATWGTSAGKLAIGAAHLAGALAAGALLDAGLALAVLAGTAGLFAIALPAIETGAAFGAGLDPSRLWGLLYAVGIAAYSTALVAWPSRSSGGTPPRWRAALLYGVAGWLGSALGVGMAEDLRRIPPLAVAAAVTVVWTACALARAAARPGGVRATLRRAAALWGPTAALALLFGGGVVAAFALRGEPAAGPAGAVARGRRVYVAEGCIHCHSQYVRAGAPSGAGDEARWGPHRPLDRSERPPLLGVRRQGPDLTNVGGRRSDAWERAHLADPRALDPGSRMPSYAHLFRQPSPGGPPPGMKRATRGDDLVAYLGSLGAGTGFDPGGAGALLPGTAEHARVARNPDAASVRGARLFHRYCAACHGADGRGAGPLADELATPAERRVMDLGKGALWSVTRGVPGAGPESARGELETIIRYGLPGTSMPGHESLTRRQISDLAAFVEERATE